jgi:acyl-ACP thioesterase
MQKIGKYEFIAEPFHCDFSGRMFLGHLGNQMLNAADFHSTGRGFGMKYLMTINRSWVLSRLAIEVNEMPTQYEHFTIETWVESAMRFFTSRNFCVTNGNGHICGYGRSIWAMIDTETRQPTDIYSIDNAAIKNWIVDDRPCPIEKGGRVRMSENVELVKTIQVTYNDIDINGHVNSVKYIEHVLDLWDIAWYGKHRLKRSEIAYVAESHYGDLLDFYLEQTAESEYCVRLAKTEVPTGNQVEVCRCKLLFVQ